MTSDDERGPSTNAVVLLAAKYAKERRAAGNDWDILRGAGLCAGIVRMLLPEQPLCNYMFFPYSLPAQKCDSRPYEAVRGRPTLSSGAREVM